MNRFMVALTCRSGGWPESTGKPPTVVQLDGSASLHIIGSTLEVSLPVNLRSQASRACCFSKETTLFFSTTMVRSVLSSALLSCEKDV